MKKIVCILLALIFLLSVTVSTSAVTETDWVGIEDLEVFEMEKPFSLFFTPGSPIVYKIKNSPSVYEYTNFMLYRFDDPEIPICDFIVLDLNGCYLNVFNKFNIKKGTTLVITSSSERSATLIFKDRSEYYNCKINIEGNLIIENCTIESDDPVELTNSGTITFGNRTDVKLNEDSIIENKGTIFAEEQSSYQFRNLFQLYELDGGKSGIDAVRSAQSIFNGGLPVSNTENGYSCLWKDRSGNACRTIDEIKETSADGYFHVEDDSSSLTASAFNKGNTFWVLCCAVILSVVIIFFLKKKNKKTEDPENTQTE